VPMLTSRIWSLLASPIRQQPVCLLSHRRLACLPPGRRRALGVGTALACCGRPGRKACCVAGLGSSGGGSRPASRQGRPRRRPQKPIDSHRLALQPAQWAFVAPHSAVVHRRAATAQRWLTAGEAHDADAMTTRASGLVRCDEKERQTLQAGERGARLCCRGTASGQAAAYHAEGSAAPEAQRQTEARRHGPGMHHRPPAAAAAAATAAAARRKANTQRCAGARSEYLGTKRGQATQRPCHGSGFSLPSPPGDFRRLEPGPICSRSSTRRSMPIHASKPGAVNCNVGRSSAALSPRCHRPAPRSTHPQRPRSALRATVRAPQHRPPQPNVALPVAPRSRSPNLAPCCPPVDG